jgi:hypothetical protein
MAFQLLRNYLTPAEGESSVRSFHITSLKSRLLSLETEGYLTVTNKRVVFYASGSSYGGRSILQSEVPIEDVSGINCYKGTYFSFLAFFAAILAAYIAATILISIIGFLILQSDITLDNYQVVLVMFWILGLSALVGSFFIPRDNIYRSILAGISALVFVALGGLGVVTGMLAWILRGSEESTNIALLIAVGVVIYSIFCFFWYARRETMSLAIGSKGGASTPIAISGISSFSLYNTAALKALSAEPARDAETMIKELGAMVLDIQALGDHGIQKWIASPRRATPSNQIFKD